MPTLFEYEYVLVILFLVGLFVVRLVFSFVLFALIHLRVGTFAWLNGQLRSYPTSYSSLIHPFQMPFASTYRSTPVRHPFLSFGSTRFVLHASFHPSRFHHSPSW